VSALSLGRQDDFGDDDDTDGWGDLDVVDPAEEAARARLNARTSTASFGAGSNRLSTSSAMTKSSSVGSHASDGWGDDEDLFEDMSAPAAKPPVSRPVAQQVRPGASMGARQSSGAHVSIGGVRRPAAPLAGSRSMGGKPPPMKLGGAKSALTSSKDIDLEAMLNE